MHVMYVVPMNGSNENQHNADIRQLKTYLYQRYAWLEPDTEYPSRTLDS